MIGKTISHYKVLEKLGEGGMGEVFLAQDTTLDRKVALKFLPEELEQDPKARKRFLREAKSAAALDHPFICHIHEIGEADGKDFIAMEYIPGQTLKDRLVQGPLPSREALAKAGEIAEALAAAHKEGIVHRDLKPSNIMLTPEGHVKVMDFGLAKRLVRGVEVGSQDKTLTASLTKTGTTLGTLAYMSPEQLRGQAVDTRSDIFSFGVVFYQMLSGVHPFRRPTQSETASAILKETPAPLSRYTEGIAELLQHTLRKMLAGDPDERYQSVHEVRTNLSRLLSEPAEAQAREPGLTRTHRGVWSAVLALLLVLLIAAISWWVFRGNARAVEPGEITSIAVLPLDNLMGDPEQEYFVDGMHEALIAQLAKIGALRVISRTSVMQYKMEKKTIPEIAQELDVDAVVEGSVLRSEQRVRITAQLVRAEPERHLWANSYERDLKDILVLQSDVAQAIANEIRVRLTPEQQASLRRMAAVNPESYEAYLKGRYHFNRYSRDGNDKALEYFRLALEKDPNFALAHAGLADTYGQRTYWGFVSPREVIPKIRAAALRAVQLDDTLGEAHDVLGRVKMFVEWDWLGAQKEFRRAIELNPNDAEARMVYSLWLATMGHSDEALAEIKRALELDPLSLALNAVHAYHFEASGQYDQAIRQIRKTLELEPNFPISHQHLWGVSRQKGMYKQALAACKKSFSLRGNSAVVEALERGNAESGYQGAMRRAAQELMAQSKLRYVSSMEVAR
ncbi:protein kinase, partial [Acidobacteria bacterium AH-259-A15]|nr:protein kinase [Acidobacteria bacterium AH-259-A15]